MASPANGGELDHLLAACDEALAAGQTTPLPNDAPPELQQRLAGAQAVLQRLHADRNTNTRQPSSIAIGRFRVLRELGRGGYGIVYLAFDPVLKREVALKVPRPEVLVTPDLRRRFLREAQAAAGLEHPHIVPVYDAGEVGPICYIASAYCRGITLAAWLRNQPSLTEPRTAAALSADLAEAMQHAHERGVLHRDLKPGNILVEPAGLARDGHPESIAVKITDFGLAKLTGSEEESTCSGAIIGTPAYMAPEQAAGMPGQIGPAADVYALGAILYEMLTDRPPFKGPTTLDTLQQVRNQDPLPPSRLHARLPRDLEIICLKCLQKEATQRYRTAGNLADDLRRFVAHQPIHARPPSWWTTTYLWARQPERVREAGTLLFSCSLLFLAWCIVGAGILWPLGVIKIEDAGRGIAYLAFAIGTVHLPMAFFGRSIRMRKPWAMWAGTAHISVVGLLGLLVLVSGFTTGIHESATMEFLFDLLIIMGYWLLGGICLIALYAQHVAVQSLRRLMRPELAAGCLAVEPSGKCQGVREMPGCQERMALPFRRLELGRSPFDSL